MSDKASILDEGRRSGAGARIFSLLAAVPLLVMIAGLMAGASGYVAYALLLFLTLACLRPMWAWAALAFALPLFGNNPGGPRALYLVDLGLAALVLRWLAGFWGSRPQRLLPSPFAAAAFFFWLVSALSLVTIWRALRAEWLYDPHWTHFIRRTYTTYATEGLFGLRAAMDLTLSMLSAMALAAQLRSWKALRNLVAIFLLSLLLTYLVGLADYFGLFPLDRLRAPNDDLAQFGYPRLQSVFYHSGWLAQYTVLLLPMFVAPPLFAWSRRKALLLPCLALILFGLLLTFARGGWLSALAALGLLAGLRTLDLLRDWRRLRRWLFGLAVAGAATMVVAVGAWNSLPARHPLRQRVLDLFALEHRRTLWGGAWRLAKLSPYVGQGIGQYYQAHLRNLIPGTRYGDIDRNWKAAAHSVPLQLLAERGPLGLASFSILFLLLASRGAQAYRACAPGDPRRPYLAGLLGALAAFAVYGVVQYVFDTRVLETVFWMEVGMLAFLWRDVFPDKPATIVPRGAVGRSACLAGLAAVMGLHAAGWQGLAAPEVFKSPDGPWVIHQKTWSDPATGSGPVLEMDFRIDHPDLAENPVMLTLRANGAVLARRRIDSPIRGTWTVLAPEIAEGEARVELSVDRVWLPYKPGSINLVFNYAGIASKGEPRRRQPREGEALDTVRSGAVEDREERAFTKP